MRTHVAEKADRNALIRQQRSLPPGQRPSLAVLAAEHGVSRERIRQIEAGRPVSRTATGFVVAVDGGRVQLQREGEGRFAAYFRSASGGETRPLGVVAGCRRRWAVEGAAGVVGESLEAISCKLVAALRAS